MMKKLIAGNWKMNGDVKSAADLIAKIEATVTPELSKSCDFVVCPPFVHIPAVVAAAKACAVGGQDCSDKESGAFTGDIAAGMLKDIGAAYVILGHSERRQYHKETDETIAAKAKTAHAAGLITIICVGETETEREAGLQESVVGGQLGRAIPETATAENTVIAYEPVWAIGTGKTATAEDIRAMHAFIRGKVPGNMRILYGGSVKPGNAAEIFAVPNVDGALIGGASLKAEDFMGIAKAA
jgi:triosephosphate isomerase (TIM)